MMPNTRMGSYMQCDKNFKIWGVSYGVVGDLIMGLPLLTHFEKFYPGSYKTWVIEKKVAFMAPFFLNHPLIDKIHITEEWSGFGECDYMEAEMCDIKCTLDNWYHEPVDWYNYRSCVDETAKIAGFPYLHLSPLEKYPKLYRWFDVGNREAISSYSKKNVDTETVENIVAIFPSATANSTTNNGRSPSMEWWNKMVEAIHDAGYFVAQFGMPTDPTVHRVDLTYNHLTFFEQVQIALGAKMSIGTDSGNMWVMGAYSHPAIHLMTQWLPNHTRNKLALAPKNLNGVDIFAEGGVDNIKHDRVINVVKEMMR